MKNIFKLPAEFRYHALVGYSICEEIIIRPIETDGPQLSKLDAPHTRYVGGTSLVVANALKRAFGLNVKLIASVGKDQYGPGRQYVETHTSNLGIDFHPLPVRKGTSTGTIVIEKGKRPQIYSDKTKYLDFPLDEVINQTQLAQPAMKVATGIMAEEAELVQTMFQATPHGIRILNPRASLLKSHEILNPLLSMTDIIAMNHEELGVWLDEIVEGHAVTKAQVQKLHDLGVQAVIITCAEHGAVLSVKHGDLFLTQPVRRFGPAVDTTGAGDSFLAAVIAAIIQGKSPEEMMHWGATLAGLKVRKEGGANVPTREEFEKAIGMPIA